MMKKLFAMAVALFTAATMFAQPESGTFSIQPSMGIDIATLSTDNTKAKVGFQGRVEASYQFNNWFAITGGLGCSQYGATATLYHLVESRNYGVDIKLGYITMPMLVNFYPVKGLAFKTGFEFGFNTSAKLKSDYFSVDIEEVQIPVGTFGAKVEDVIVTLPIGASYEYKHFVLDMRYNIGLSDAIENIDSKTNAFVVTLGYKFDL